MIRKILKELGFIDIGTKNRFVHEELGIIVEYMGETPKAERLDIVKVKDVEVNVISIEDIVIEKLRLIDRGYRPTKIRKTS